MKLNFTNVVIIGAGVTGLATAEELSKFTNNITVMDIKPHRELVKETIFLEKLNVKTIFGEYNKAVINNASLVILSPGVSLNLPVLTDIKQKNIPIISEIELAYNLLNKNVIIVAITGTNGKTTTTTLVGEVLKKKGSKVKVCGNIGYPLISEVKRVENNDIIVAEVSSFQLEIIKEFKPYISCILNIAQDHLDRHVDLNGYINAKKRIFENQTENEFCILNYDNELVKNLEREVKSNLFYFSKKEEVDNGSFIKEGGIYNKTLGKTSKILKIDEIKKKNFLENYLATITICSILNIDKEIIKEVIVNFEGLKHRQELIKEINGIKFINDSKATNPHATINAINNLKEPIILIAGGKDKGFNFSYLAQVIKQKVKKLILIGEAKDKIKKCCEEVKYNDFIEVASLKEAVNIAYTQANSHDVILFSPACASFDMFLNYEDRGDKFREIVNELEKTIG